MVRSRVRLCVAGYSNDPDDRRNRPKKNLRTDPDNRRTTHGQRGKKVGKRTTPTFGVDRPTMLDGMEDKTRTTDGQSPTPNEGVIRSGEAYSRAEAMRRFGGINDRTWQRWRKAGLPTVRMGGFVWVLADDLLAWMEKRRDPPDNATD